MIDKRNKKYKNLPRFFSIKRAREVQRELSKRIIKNDSKLSKCIENIAGVDISYIGDMGIGAIAVLDFNSLNIKEKVTSITKISFPYIPTLLSFRELKPAIQAFLKIKSKVDVFMIDAHGYAHPYRLGFASHFGVVIKRPTIGVAKSYLFGEVKKWKSNIDLLYDKEEIIGAVLRVKKNQRPIYVSIGNMISLDTAIDIVLRTIKNGNRLPEPTRQAHLLATTTRRKILYSL